MRYLVRLARVRGFFGSIGADEAAYGVRLPVHGFHDLGQRRALGALHHGDHLRLLVGAVRLLLGGLLGVARAFFGDLAFLALRPPFAGAAADSGLLMFSLSIAFSLIELLLDRVAVVTVITPVRRNCKQNLYRLADWGEGRVGIRRFGVARPFFNRPTKSVRPPSWMRRGTLGRNMPG
jgi:hypothetical protein